MRLTYRDDGLRGPMHLAGRDESLATIEGISQADALSSSHLMKVVHELGRVR
ncbi:MAG: hypothetical protein HKP27_02065 [Myxococcales bacterium]|nr:hypothetical protein [Myxococcales bacterium]